MANQRKVTKKQTVNLGVRKPQELSYVNSQLDLFSTVVGYGYSENNWCMAHEIYRSLEGHLMPDEREVLANLMREGYVYRNQAKTTTEISLLKSKLAGNNV